MNEVSLHVPDLFYEGGGRLLITTRIDPPITRNICPSTSYPCLLTWVLEVLSFLSKQGHLPNNRQVLTVMLLSFRCG